MRGTHSLVWPLFFRPVFMVRARSIDSVRFPLSAGRLPFAALFDRRAVRHPIQSKQKADQSARFTGCDRVNKEPSASQARQMCGGRHEASLRTD